MSDSSAYVYTFAITRRMRLTFAWWHPVALLCFARALLGVL